MEAIRVEARRNGVVEAVHRVHAVEVRGGDVVRAAGDPALVCFMRSSAKPIQALPLVRARDDLDDRDLAIASASHPGLDEHLEAVRALLAKAPAGEDELECGGGIVHNCSGKHAGMLALCRACDWPGEGYRLAGHPCQEAMLSAFREAAGREPLATAVDGCGVVTFALPLAGHAHAFARLAELEGGPRVLAAMRRRPGLVGAARGADVRLMQARPRWAAKGGAEGLLCALGPDGTGVALKCEDGSSRALAVALGAFLEVAELAVATLANSRGDPVGELVTSVVAS